MPRPDGTLYNFEKAKIVEDAKPKPVVIKRKPGRPAQLKVLPDLPKANRAINKPVREFIAKLPKPDLRKRLDPEALKACLGRIRSGLPVDSALVLAGISRKNMDRWRQRNPALENEFQKAESEFEESMVANIHKFTGSDVKAAQWMLERRKAGSWASVSKQEHTGKNGGPMQEITIAKQLLGTVASPASDRIESSAASKSA